MISNRVVYLFMIAVLINGTLGIDWSNIDFSKLDLEKLKQLGIDEIEDLDHIDIDRLEINHERLKEAGIDLHEIEKSMTEQIQDELERIRESDDTVCCLDEENRIEKLKKRLWKIRKVKDKIPVKLRRNATCIEGRILYPFGPECGDRELSKDMTRSHVIDLGYDLRFMGHKFNKAYVNQHGFISFQDSFLGNTLTHEAWPHPMYPYVDDPVFIAPFYAQTDLLGDKLEDVIDTEHGRVLYKVIIRKDLPLVYKEEEKFLYEMTMRLFDNVQVCYLNILSDSKTKIAVNFGFKLKREIRESLAGGEEFEAKYALMVTWKNVTFLGNSLLDINLRPRNTFQAMIISDDYHSYAIFNYEHISWYSTPSTGGNPETGTGGQAARIGFNRGNGTQWFPVLPFSENAQLIEDIGDHTNIGEDGRFIFRIDEWIQPAGCLDIDFDTYDHKKELIIWPRNGNMLGGTEVNITGPCFIEETFFLCKWGDGPESEISVGETTFIEDHHTDIRGRCVQPTIFYNGRINLSISLDDGVTWDWKGEFNLVDPFRYPPLVELVDIEKWYEVSVPGRLVIRWDKIDIGYGESDLVDIELWGYYEDDYGPHWDFIQLLGEKKLNKGSFGFDVAPNRAPNETMARRYTMGAIGISMFDSQYAAHSPHFSMSLRIWSPLHPLGWWRNDEMKFYYDKHSFLFGNSRGKNWAEDQCRWWHEYRRFEDRSWMDELPLCPPTIFFAIGDAGVWSPDPSCNMENEDNPINCMRHPDAKHCVITLKQTSSGAGNRCCYDEEGNLMYTNDTASGSKPDRFHFLGSPPYNEYGKVPALSHYYHDIVPYYLCCYWSNLCDSYLYLRQTRDSKGYKESRLAAAYGDPHLMTFDGKDYTFNGKGEFTLFRSKKHNFRLQARFEQPPNATFCLYSSKGQINATRITAITAGQEDSDIVEVRARVHPTQTYRFQCDVVVNGRVYYFNFTEEKTQMFKNVFIVNAVGDTHQANFSILFSSSNIGINCECIDGLIHVRASAPASLFKDTNGLFGYWDNITGNDFTSPDGSSNQITIKPEFLYQRFGMAWRIKDESESIFHYSGSWSYDTFHDQRPFIREWQRFRPWFTATEIPFPSNVTFTKEEMIEMCEGDEQCLYDAAALGSLEVGEKTRDAHRYYRLLHDNMKSVNSCGIYLLKGGKRNLSNGNYLAGSVMRISCDKGYTLFGYPEFFCNWNGTWLPTNGQWIDRFRNWPYCEHYHITAIRWTSVGISIAWTVLLAAAFIYAIFVKKQRDYRLDDPEYPEYPDDHKPQDEPYVEEETKNLEQIYYKDGFVPSMKVLSNLTKSIHSLNQENHTNDSSFESSEDEIIDADKEFSTADMVNNSGQSNKSSTILRIPPSSNYLIPIPQAQNSPIPSSNMIQPKPLDNSTPINRNSNIINGGNQYQFNFNNEQSSSPSYYVNNQAMTINNNAPLNGNTNNTYQNQNGNMSNSIEENPTQQQYVNPYLQRIKELKERQQKQLEAQINSTNTDTDV